MQKIFIYRNLWYNVKKKQEMPQPTYGIISKRHKNTDT